MKKAVIIIVTVLAVGALAFGLNWLLAPGTGKSAPVAAPAAKTNNTPPSDLVMGDPLESSGLRFDGVYHAEVSDIHYYMRFFPAGHVAMVGGPEDPSKGGSLRTMLHAGVLSQRNIGLYNIPVQWRGDSLYMTAKGPKGDILYSGIIDAGVKLTMRKESMANGHKAVIDYHFEADGEENSAEQGK